jgi:GT2 family glycosyltransferase
MLPKQPKVFVIIPVHNRKHFTYECLDSLTQQSYSNISIIVVDDGSTDGTSEMIARYFSEVKVLHGDGYLWWTGAINFGIKEALRIATHEDFILVINDDVIVGISFW